MRSPTYRITGAQTVSLSAGVLAAVLTVTETLAPLGAAWLRTAAGSSTPFMVISAAGGLLGAAGLRALRPARSSTRTPVA